MTPSHSIRVGIVDPQSPLVVRTIPHTLNALQAIVGGDLEHWATDGHVAILCNEDGWSSKLPINREFILADGTRGTFVGTVLLTGFNAEAGAFESLTDTDITTWTRQLHRNAQHDIHYTTYYQRLNALGHLSRIRLSFDVNNTITPVSARTWARAIARDWGPIQSETKHSIPGWDGWIGWFTGSDHGGYVVITRDGPDAWDRWAQEGDAVEHHNGFHDMTAYVFEKDRDWVILESTFPSLLPAVVQRRLGIRPADPTAWHTAIASHRRAITDTLAHYYPDWTPPILPGLA
jgi:hypothetical protein